MKYSELNKKTIDELDKQIHELREDLFQLHIKNKTNQLEDKSQIGRTRKDIARILTKRNELQQKNA